MSAHEIMGELKNPRFVLFCSYGNDSVALIQWAYESGLADLVCVYSDTGWAAPWWRRRVERMEYWVHSLGFWTSRTKSIGFVELARQKKAFPTQQFQWCSYKLKIEPAFKWLEEVDPDKKAVCLVGVRREESLSRKSFPSFLAKSANHGDRVMIAPLVEFSENDRNLLLQRAKVKPLNHRSMECSPCVNSNRKDLRALTEESIREVEILEEAMHSEFGLTKNGKKRTLFRPHRHGGAVGIREVVKWAKSSKGKYVPDDESESLSGCDTGFCGV